MKKLMLIFIVMALILFSFNVFAQAQSSWSIKAGLDFSSKIDIDDTSYDADMGYSLTGEFKMPYSNNLNVGAGMAYQLSRDADEVDFGFTPFYALAEYRMGDSPLYLIGHFGYAGFRLDADDYENSSGGLYYALGGGMEVGQRYEAELLYTQNNGEVEDTAGDSLDVDYSKITVSFGMRF